MNVGNRLPYLADVVATWIGNRHPWIDPDAARRMIRVDIEISRPHVAGCTESGLAYRSALRVVRRLFPDEPIPEEHDCLKSSERS